jgi:hypothetical protein
MPDNTDPIRVALYGLLSGDDTLNELAPGGIHHQRVPAGTTGAYAIFNKQSGVPVRSFGDASKNELWLVKGLCRGDDQEEAEAIDARCKELLDKARFEIVGSQLLGIERETDVIIPEDDAGETIFHVGALYRLQTLPVA